MSVNIGNPVVWIVGLVWLVAAVVFVLFLGCVYTAYGVGYGARRGWAWYTAKYRSGGRHRS